MCYKQLVLGDAAALASARYAKLRGGAEGRQGVPNTCSDGFLLPGLLQFLRDREMQHLLHYCPLNSLKAMEEEWRPTGSGLRCR